MTAPVAIPLPRIRQEVSANRGLTAGVGLLLAALLGMTLLQYTLPARCDAHWWGLDPEGMRQFATHYGLSGLPRMDADHFSLAFRLMLVGLWSGWALALAAGGQAKAIPTRPILTAVVLTALLTAIFSPPLLSHDVYAYDAQGRLFTLYGQNPYFSRPSFLVSVADPAAGFVTWNTPSVYGPVWTGIEAAITFFVRGVWPQVIVLKLVEGVALIGTALAGRRITAILCPGRENLTLLAIGLNPLLILEGPGSGHNDLLLVCCLLVGAMFYLEKKYIPAALFLGLSVGIKLVTLAVLPWALREYSRGRPRRQVVIAIATGSLVALLPLVLGYAPFWHGSATLAAMGQRSLYHAGTAALASDFILRRWLLAHGVGSAAAPICVALFQNRVSLAVYAALSACLWRVRAPGAWLTAWAIFAATLMFFALGLPFPWYIAWFWPVCLLRWNRFHLGLSGICFGLSLGWMSGYGIVCQLR